MAFKPIPENAIIGRDGEVIKPRTDRQLITALEKAADGKKNSMGRFPVEKEAADRISRLLSEIKELRRDVNTANREIDRAYEQGILDGEG